MDPLPPSVTELDVVGAGAPPVDEADDETAVEAVSTWTWRFRYRGRFYLRGRGLESEWSGEFEVKGTARDPKVTGFLKPLRGDFTLAGKLFKLGQGRIPWIAPTSSTRGSI